MSASTFKGALYRCPVCGSELAVIHTGTGAFTPHCCNRPMALAKRRALFFVCPVCGAELATVGRGGERFEPWCCNRPMVCEAA